MTNIEKEGEALESKYNGMTANAPGDKSYEVTGWYMDSNGCLKTHGDGYDESFISDTEYT